MFIFKYCNKCVIFLPFYPSPLVNNYIILFLSVFNLLKKINIEIPSNFTYISIFC